MTDKKKKTILPYSVLLMLIALGLSYIEIFKWPFGTFVTLASFVPLLVIVYKYGVKWGLFTGLFFGLIKGGIDVFLLHTAGELPTSADIAVVFVLDFVVAYAVLGFAGLFRDRIESDLAGNLLGGGFAVILNWAAHFVSRFLIYGKEAKTYLLQMKDSFGGTKWAGTSLESFVANLCDNVIAHHTGNYRGEIYAFLYTASYMLPELILTLLIVLLLMVVPKVKDFVSYD